jgi:hypothetical protein
VGDRYRTYSPKKCRPVCLQRPCLKESRCAAQPQSALLHPYDSALLHAIPCGHVILISVYTGSFVNAVSRCWTGRLPLTVGQCAQVPVPCTKGDGTARTMASWCLEANSTRIFATLRYACEFMHVCMSVCVRVCICACFLVGVCTYVRAYKHAHTRTWE